MKTRRILHCKIGEKKFSNTTHGCKYLEANNNWIPGWTIRKRDGILAGLRKEKIEHMTRDSCECIQNKKSAIQIFHPATRICNNENSTGKTKQTLI